MKIRKTAYTVPNGNKNLSKIFKKDGKAKGRPAAWSAFYLFHFISSPIENDAFRLVVRKDNGASVAGKAIGAAADAGQVDFAVVAYYAKAMLAAGIPAAQIVSLTGLSEEQVEGLK